MKLFELRPFAARLTISTPFVTSSRNPRPQPDPSVTVESPTSTIRIGRNGDGPGSCEATADVHKTRAPARGKSKSGMIIRRDSCQPASRAYPPPNQPVKASD
jgi:hypothetical protein